MSLEMTLSVLAGLSVCREDRIFLGIGNTARTVGVRYARELRPSRLARFFQQTIYATQSLLGDPRSPAIAPR
jgi:hypothetical protein